jgi:hypothetical protein
VYAYSPSSGQWYRLVTVTRGLSGVRGAGLGATQNVSITGPGNISANVSIGDTLVVTLTEGAAGTSTSSMAWAPTNPVVVNPTNLGTASGATPGGFDPFTLESITGSGTVTFQWIDTYGNTQTTTLTVTASATPPPNTNPPNTNPPNTNPPNTNPPNTNPPNTNPTNTASTGTSTGTIVAIAGAAIVAGGLLAYALAHRAPPSAMPPAAAPRRLPAARTSTPRRKQPRNTRRTAARRRR